MKIQIGSYTIPITRKEFEAPSNLEFTLNDDNETQTNDDNKFRGGSVENKYNEGPGSTASTINNNKNINSLPHLASVVDMPSEFYRVRRVTGDGRCLFRSIALGVARQKNIFLSQKMEMMEADNLRHAVREALCTPKIKQYKKFQTVAKMLDEPLFKYCFKLKSPNFWGGEPELIVLSELLKVPIIIYKDENEMGRKGTGFVKIVEYGINSHKKKEPVKLLYTGSNHYDLLF